MCCFLGICEAVGLVLTTLVISLLSAYGVKAIYVASLEHRKPELWDAFSEKFWLPEGAVFWATFIITAILLMTIWFLLHQLCNCCSVCRRNERPNTPSWWRRLQSDTEPSEAELAAYNRLRSEVARRQTRRGSFDAEMERYKSGGEEV
jgi:hypothetical protein